MKILITIPQLDMMGGVANYYNVLQSYLPLGIDYFTACRREGENVIQVPLRMRADYKKFKQLVAEYDIVHLNPSLLPKAIIRDGLFLRAAKKQGKKVVVFIHGWDLNFEAKFKARWLWLFRKYYFQADAFIVLADKFKASLREMGYAGPVYLETTTVDDRVLDYYRGQDEIDEKIFNVLFLSRVEKKKGIYEAIDACKLINEQHEVVSLTIAGDGAELADAKEYVSTNKIRCVNFAGYVQGDAKYQLLNWAECFLFPSHYGEGMPTCVLEAMTFGLPVITRPVGGLKDFFEDGKMGFISKSLEASVFADLLEKLRINPQLRMQMERFNHNYAKERFIASTVAKRLEDIYSKVLES
ncbi:MAG: glycosyltransferase [Desulfobacteraceae bacterium]|nr:glycosyltransferase [Desulfobacteraceae bacterium]